MIKPFPMKVIKKSKQKLIAYYRFFSNGHNIVIELFYLNNFNIFNLLFIITAAKVANTTAEIATIFKELTK